MKIKAFAALILGMAIVLASCGDNASSGAEFNDHDATFAQGMIPHHRQAVEMAELAGTRATNPQVKDLAAMIRGSQDPEIGKMEDWLSDWDEPAADDAMTGMDHGSDGGDSMAGMMSDSDMKLLGRSSGTAFDTMFLTMMIRHHRGAITMAGDELADGENGEAVALAKSIIGAQTSEIDTMKDLLER